MIGTRAPSTKSRGIRLCKESQVLGQHVAGFEIGHDQNLRAARDRRFDALDSRRLRVDGVVEGERAVEHAAGDLAAVRHLAQCRRFDGRGDLRRNSLDRRKNGDARRAEADMQ